MSEWKNKVWSPRNRLALAGAALLGLVARRRRLRA